MKLMAIVALAGGFVAAPMVGAPVASGLPVICDGAECVQFVDRGAVLGEACEQSTRYNFGLDPSGNTLVCTFNKQWVASAPLVGIRPLRSSCGEDKGVAQTPDGLPLSCIDGSWTYDVSAVFYKEGSQGVSAAE